MCREAYESPALPLTYSAVDYKLTERDQGRQPRLLERITIAQHITIEPRVTYGQAADSRSRTISRSSELEYGILTPEVNIT